MEVWSVALASFGFLFAGFVKGATGLGFSTSCLPFLALAVGMETALPLVLVPSITSNAIVMIDAGHIHEVARRFWPMFVAALAGIICGLLLLVFIDKQIAAAILGAVLIVYSAYALAKPDLKLPSSLERPLYLPVGLSTGIINGMTGCQLIPVLPYLVSLRLDPSKFVQAINISFTVSSLVMAYGLSRIGYMTWQVAGFSALGLVPMYLGVTSGARLRRKLSMDTFRVVVLGLLIFLGLLLMTRALLS